jgi:hypothetical protein
MWSLFALADPFRGDGLGSASLRRRHYRTTAMPMNRPIAAWPRPSAIRVAALPETERLFGVPPFVVAYS